MTHLSSRIAAMAMTLAVACALPLSTVAHAQSADFRLGTAIKATQAERSITIVPGTRWANVKQGEAIRFLSGQNTFGWKFDGTRSAVDLATVAPAGFVTGPFMVYVAPASHGRRAN